MPAASEPCVLLKLGEIVLKGRNRQQFERLLQNNIRLAVADLGIGLRLWQRNGVIVLSPVLDLQDSGEKAELVRRPDRRAHADRHGLGQGLPGEPDSQGPADRDRRGRRPREGADRLVRRPGQAPRQAIRQSTRPSWRSRSAARYSAGTATRSTCVRRTSPSASRSISPRSSSTPTARPVRAACRSA